MTTSVFLDTSILIGLQVHHPEIKKFIRSKIKEFNLSIVSLVVVQEFSRRFLNEAQYLLDLLDRKGSVQNVQFHLLSLSPMQQRKLKICLYTLFSCFNNESDKDRSDRLRLFLKYILENSIDDLKDDHQILKTSRCGAGLSVLESKNRKRRIANKKCVKNKDCEIVRFLTNSNARNPLLAYLLSLRSTELTNELKNGIIFLQSLSDTSVEARETSPCLKHGDIVISLESRPILNFFSMNFRESEILCKQAEQTLITCPTNADKIDGWLTDENSVNSKGLHG